MIKENAVSIFNEMKDEYDDLKDLWYSWLFSRLHLLIAKQIIEPIKPKTVLDVGCGTGFQSYLFASSGSNVTGIDIAEDLIGKAISKQKYFDPTQSIELFPSYFSFVDKYNKLIQKHINRTNIYKHPEFKIGDAQNLDFPNNSFDHVNCCGSTFNFIDNYKMALKEISRVLKPGGTFSFEVDARWNMDIFWPIIDNMTYKEAFKNIFQPVGNHIKIDYPFGDSDNPVMMDIWLFTKEKFDNDLQNVGLITNQIYSIHSFTNFIPSTILDSPKPNSFTRLTFEFLSRIDELPLFNKFPGCSLVFFGAKNQ
jgi:ubiquinone/menaquinone biosynthesis C-methylase UbiE